MAVSLSSNFSLCSPPRSSASASASKSQHYQIGSLTPLQRLSHTPNLLHSNPDPVLGFSLSKLRPFRDSNFRRSFRPCLSVQNFTPQDEDETSPHDPRTAESSAEQRQKLSLKNLLKVYKEAVLYQDVKTTLEVEAMVAIFENEKNDLSEKLSAMSTEINSGKEKHIRLQADFDNFRKRSEKERLTIRSDAEGEVIESLLPIVDSFERAKQHIKPETEKELKIYTSYQGIYKQFVEIMRSLQVAAVPTIGKPFDPLVHEAIAREESQEFKEGVVVRELRRGFFLGSRLLRPALVKVSSGPGKIRVDVATEKPTAAAAGVDER